MPRGQVWLDVLDSCPTCGAVPPEALLWTDSTVGDLVDGPEVKREGVYLVWDGPKAKGAPVYVGKLTGAESANARFKRHLHKGGGKLGDAIHEAGQPASRWRVRILHRDHAACKFAVRASHRLTVSEAEAAAIRVLRPRLQSE